MGAWQRVEVALRDQIRRLLKPGGCGIEPTAAGNRAHSGMGWMADLSGQAEEDKEDEADSSEELGGLAAPARWRWAGAEAPRVPAAPTAATGSAPRRELTGIRGAPLGGGVAPARAP